MKLIVSLILFAAAAAAARATLITIPLVPDNHVHNQLIVPTNDFAGITLTGQTMSVDFTFGSSFIHLFPGTSRNFEIAPTLMFRGVGFLHLAAAQSWTVGADGERNSVVWQTSGGSGESDIVTLYGVSFGYVFPMFSDPTGSSIPGALDIYGYHADVTLPNAPGFEFVGFQFDMYSSGPRWHNQFAIGPHVPDTGSTLALLSVALLTLFACTRVPAAALAKCTW